MTTPPPYFFSCIYEMQAGGTPTKGRIPRTTPTGPGRGTPHPSAPRGRRGHGRPRGALSDGGRLSCPRRDPPSVYRAILPRGRRMPLALLRFVAPPRTPAADPLLTTVPILFSPFVFRWFRWFRVVFYYSGFVHQAYRSSSWAMCGWGFGGRLRKADVGQDGGAVG
ncbi:hypothetical protein BD779DRAFT_1787075 [Infundibulicybe gibba]|nr:hypothetical protein BD779DRAFT_1787075 [Infundibulicybe gibba]